MSRATLSAGPTCPESEMIVIGCILQDPSAYDLAASMLTADDFFDYKHQRIFDAATRVKNNGLDPLLTTVTKQLRDEAQLEEIGSHAYLCSLVERTPTTALLSYHVRQIREAACVRAVATACEQIAVIARARGPWRPLFDRLVVTIQRYGVRPTDSNVFPL